MRLPSVQSDCRIRATSRQRETPLPSEGRTFCRDSLIVSLRAKPLGSRLLLLTVPLELGNEDEVLVFLVAHEAFHYLRRTKQVQGRHGEIEGDTFALKTLEQYRERTITQ